MPATGHPCLTFDAGDRFAEHYGLGAAAFRYLAWGYKVIPLAPGLKRPHAMLPVNYSPGARNGVYHSTDSAGQVAAWWGQDRAANVGIATGSRSHLMVVDLDVKRGEDGPGSFARHVGHWDLLPPGVPAVMTPSGGWHLWFRLPDGVVIPERPSILPGVDIKGEGGLVAAPPSMQLLMPMVRPGENAEAVPVPYDWVEGCPCSAPEAPPWLIEWVQMAPGYGGAGGGDHGSLADLDELARTGIPVGQRNAVLYRLACGRFRLHGTGSGGWAMVADDLNRVLAATDTQGFSGSELRTIMLSAYRFVTEQEDAERAQMASWERKGERWLDAHRWVR